MPASSDDDYTPAKQVTWQERLLKGRGDGTRRVVAITEVTGMEVDVITLEDIFMFQKRGIDPDGKVVGRFAATGKTADGGQAVRGDRSVA